MAGPLEGAKSEGVDGLVDEESPFPLSDPRKRLLDVVFDWPSGLLKLNKEPLPAPVLAPGGGPAGVVELLKSEVVCLLVGVVLLASLVLALLPKTTPLPEAAPKVFMAVWEAVSVSVGLLGVENNDPEGALLAVCPNCEFGWEELNNPLVVVLVLVLVEGPKLNPLPAAGLLASPNELLPLLAPPNGELAAGPPAPAPNKEPVGAELAGVLPKSPPPVLVEAGVADPKTPPEDGALEVLEPKSPVPPVDDVGWLKEKVGWVFEGSAILSRDIRSRLLSDRGEDWEYHQGVRDLQGIIGVMNASTNEARFC